MTKRRFPVLTALAAAAFLTLPVAAQVYPARTIGLWTLAQSEDGRGCFLTRQYDGVGDTTLLMGLDVSGRNHLSVLNDNWSIKPRERLKLNFRLSKGGYANQVSIGLASNGKKGFVTAFEPKFLVHFATSDALQISRDEVPVEQLNLAGSGAAVAQLRKCVEAQRTAAGSMKKDAKPARAIPKDPFAPGAKKRKKR
jgi:hypothetical protein